MPSSGYTLVVQIYKRGISDPLFRYYSKGQVNSLTYGLFLSMLKQKLQQLGGFQADQYAGHSFRRGGTTLALSCNIPAELVKVLVYGDWTNSAYLRYFEPSLSTRFTLAQALANQIH